MGKSEIEKRKFEHVAISLGRKVESEVSAGFEDVELVHCALPEMNFSEVKTEIKLFGKKLSAPLIIAGMTGGYEKAEEINKSLAAAAQELGIGIGVGSQRAAILDKKLEKTYSVVRKAAPDAFVIGNLGAVQLAKDFGIKEAKKAVEMIQADALAVHLNPLHEVVQGEGDKNFKGCLNAISKLKELEVPIIVKETGAGISREVAVKLERAGADAIDIGGLGGTSFAAVEYYRKNSEKELAKLFWSWGIPTAVSTIEASQAVKIPVIATGGVRTGIDTAKAIAAGAACAGMALPFLKAAKNKKAKDEGERIIKELKTAMLLIGAKNIEQLKSSNAIIRGKTREWLELRGIDCRKFANRRVVM